MADTIWVEEAAGASAEAHQRVLPRDALEFVADLQRRMGSAREGLLARRIQRLEDFRAGILPEPLADSAFLRKVAWQVAPAPPDLVDRRVEITGPVERKMMINALNSGARVFMADLEDSCSPTWANILAGQRNLRDAVRRELSLDVGGKEYRLNEVTATLVVRPRGWHLVEKHITVGDRPISA